MAEKSMDMVIPARGKIEWNLNTIVILAGIAAGFVAWGVTLGTFSSNMTAMDNKFTREIERIDMRSDQRRAESEQRWRDHDLLHKERNSDNAANQAKTDERVRNLETETRKLENLTYRMTVQEAGLANFGKAFEGLTRLVNEQAIDTRIIKQIVEQMREAQGLPRRPTNN